MTLLGGQPVPLPADLDPARYPDAITVGCPSNQTGDKSVSLQYELAGDYRTLTARLSGWSGTGRPYLVQVEVYAVTREADDTMQSEKRQVLTTTVNKPAVDLRADVTAAGAAGRAGEGAEQMELRFICERPGGAVILSDARLTS